MVVKCTTNLDVGDRERGPLAANPTPAPARLAPAREEEDTSAPSSSLQGESRGREKCPCWLLALGVCNPDEEVRDGGFVLEEEAVLLSAMPIIFIMLLLLPQLPLRAIPSSPKLCFRVQTQGNWCF